MAMKKLTKLPENKIQEFADEYYSRINENKISPKSFVICLVGQVKSGKTTIAEFFETELDLAHVSNDEIRKLLRIENSFSTETYSKIMPIVLERLLSEHRSVVYGSNCARRETREFVEALTEKYNTPIIWIHINPVLKNIWMIFLIFQTSYLVTKLIHHNLIL